MAGAKLLEQLNSSDPIHTAASSYIETYSEVWQNRMPFLNTPPPQYPDIILLQECIGFIDHSPTPIKVNGNLQWQSGKEILESIYQGYNCFFFQHYQAITLHILQSGKNIIFNVSLKLNKDMGFVFVRHRVLESFGYLKVPLRFPQALKSTICVWRQYLCQLAYI